MCHSLLVRGNLTDPIKFPFSYFFFFFSVFTLGCFLTHKGNNYWIFLLLHFFLFLCRVLPWFKNFSGFKNKVENDLPWYYYLKKWALLSCSRDYKCVWCDRAFPVLFRPLYFVPALIENSWLSMLYYALLGYCGHYLSFPGGFGCFLPWIYCTSQTLHLSLVQKMFAPS